MNTQSFLATHPVFTVEELDQFLEAGGRATPYNRKRLLGYHRERGRLVVIRPGLYGVVPLGSDAASFPLDPTLIATRLRPDAVLGYHSALAFHGFAHSQGEEYVVLTHQPLAKPFHFRGGNYRTVQPPKALAAAGAEAVGVEQRERQNLPVRVTGLERTVVDCLDRPRLGGEWEEVWRSCEAVPYVDVDLMVRYTLLLENATTAATVGYFLRLQEARWKAPPEALEPLRAHRPKQPHYLGRRREERGRLISEWNLVVPERIVQREWEERDATFA